MRREVEDVSMEIVEIGDEIGKVPPQAAGSTRGMGELPQKGPPFPTHLGRPFPERMMGETQNRPTGTRKVDPHASLLQRKMTVPHGPLAFSTVRGILLSLTILPCHSLTHSLTYSHGLQMQLIRLTAEATVL